mmetsp:Transcript_1440/g.4329  ORF Transcript_1440/g.4329 Transcript_1440/m.4329 type:complete len:227 (-) Transcript_1440:959-1639(-)
MFPESKNSPWLLIQGAGYQIRGLRSIPTRLVVPKFPGRSIRMRRCGSPWRRPGNAHELLPPFPGACVFPSHMLHLDGPLTALLNPVRARPQPAFIPLGRLCSTYLRAVAVISRGSISSEKGLEEILVKCVHFRAVLCLRDCLTLPLDPSGGLVVGEVREKRATKDRKGPARVAQVDDMLDLVFAVPVKALLIAGQPGRFVEDNIGLIAVREEATDCAERLTALKAP